MVEKAVSLPSYLSALQDEFHIKINKPDKFQKIAELAPKSQASEARKFLLTSTIDSFEFHQTGFDLPLTKLNSLA
jgi:hypothetical protein